MTDKEKEVVDALMNAAINAVVEWRDEDNEVGFNNNFNARMLGLEWKIEECAKVLACVSEKP